MKSAILLLAWCLGAGSAAAETLSVQKDLPIPGARDARATVFSAPARSARVEVVPALQLRMGSSNNYGEVTVSVQDIARNLGQYKSQLRRPTDADYLLVNGGFSAAQVDRPAGLLVARDRIVSIPSYSRVAAEPRSACPFVQKDHFRLSALLCVDKEGRTSVDTFTGKNITACSHAIQAGPMLVEAGTAAVCKRADLSTRTALCLTRGAPETRELKVVVTKHPVTLYELAAWLQAPTEQGGLNCQTAMNLGGDDSSGAVLFPRSRQGAVAPLIVGDGTYPQASFVAVTVR